ncbi:penicillin acylase family protein [Metabacillus iocasae]|uniref:Penicillin amidase n=1 Tax=Priestia iocasae TaxID=2291674 RepID=A0ABS2QYE2_9BACI|nr:penicillin acylase family protein [Metabacillus iocasae]MBM7703962.1 penicillin amidase [Metabacillus iocasae]
MEVLLHKKQQRKRKMFIISLWTFSILTLVGLGTIFTIEWYITRSAPQTSGTLQIKGLEHPVTVVRDEQGVPHIQAETERDLYIAQGFVTAQDRMFQMDLSRRQASGRLSEVVGEAAVNRDKYFRTLGLRRAAIASYDIYSEEAKQILAWYAEGVNAYLTHHPLPVEFTLLGYQPEKWTPVDSLTIGKYMAFDLGGHWQGQAFRYELLKQFPKEKAYELFPTYPKEAPTIVKEESVDVEKSFATAVIPPEFNGSNNWVISGEKSESGKPILADDPHLSLATPSIWYQTHLQTLNLNVSGVILAGIPGIILGHNDTIAWGVTNTGPDVQDLYIEKRHPDKKDEFLYNNKWEKADVISEPIVVKEGETIPYEVTITRHGPVLSEFAYENKDNTVFSLRWTALDPSNELEAIVNMNKAKSWAEFEQALEQFHTPAQNFVFAHKDGTIAYKANGRIPIRKKGDGLLPVPGWTNEYEWEGFIPFNELPHTINPKEGFISTANNKVIDHQYPYHISHVWAQPYRQMRIQQVLNEKDKLTVEDMKALQMDPYNLQAEEFVPLFLDALRHTELDSQEKAALQQLKSWNYQDRINQAAPLIFHRWMKEIDDTLFAAELSPELLALFKGRGQIIDELLRKSYKGESITWIDEKGGLQKILTSSLTHTVEDLTNEFGEKVEAWKWGDYHQISFVHPLSSVPALKSIFNRQAPLPVAGSRVTVQAVGWNDETGMVNHGGSWRFVIDMNDTSKGYHLVGPGQSGHVKSKWYSNQTEAWVEGMYHETKIDDPHGTTLTLIP